MSKQIKWGIVGLGNISDQFVTDLCMVDTAEVYAVASRTQNKADAFAKKFSAEKAYGSYEDIFKDPQVDIIYIGTPHDSHAELSIKAMTHGKHVLCEKPVALNYEQALKMVNASKAHKKFFMEAFWTRFNPSVQEALYQIRKGVIGKVKYINADFAFYVPVTEGSRMTNKELGGGTLLDMGVYPLFLSYVVLGMPKKVLASANFYASGCDKQTAMILQYDDAQAVLHSSFVSPSNMMATISGEAGRINLNSVWHETQSYSLLKNNHVVDYAHPTKGKGFTYEIEECHRCIREHKIESDLWSHQDSLNLISIVDEVRKQIGLKYPSE
ncbi:Gfo/Idh/MocA family protein [Winogradskyella sp.]|uniref:Gfo/Idh/MocA family protein n=1 Tax=Winogradskyella sp. TaxID=1883156 RepID=UPI003BA8AF14